MRSWRGVVAIAVAAACAWPAVAFAPRARAARFDALVIDEPSAGLATVGTPAASLDATARRGWDSFVAEAGEGWQGWFDARSGVPLLVQGAGLRWVPVGTVPTLTDLEAHAREFIERHPVLLGSWTTGQFEFDRAASGPLTDGVWQITFRQRVDGVAVEGPRLDFHVAHGQLVAFGAANWAPVRRGATASVGVDAARAALENYLDIHGGEVVDLEPPALRLVPADPRNTPLARWDGPVGAGLTHVLAWRFVLSVPGEPATWVALVNADDASIVSFVDDTKYDRIKGSVYPTSDDGLCPTGCAQPDYPMPYADYSVDGGPAQYTGDHGLYTCGTIGATVRTTLAGPYIRVQDNCGAINETTTCDEPLDLQTVTGTDCAVPPGSSPGNTHSSRSSFYHLNRAMEKGRGWLPDNNWLKSQVVDNVNINSTCNAYWSGSVNFYRSGGGCRNTGEIAGVFVHEWGHGIDQNDGGGYDNPSEAYADVVAFLDMRESCVGRGFFMSQNCSGYGNACLNCTGIRDQDWAKRANNTPSTADGFIGNNCGGGGGPCGKEVHCEGYLAGETVWDLANRDLPAFGLDADSAWQLTDKLFFKSRAGSGGNAYNCSGATSDGCGTNSWFHKFRLIDDDDGNLNNGTPHAAAIYAAFARHKIACGNAGDASNQNSGSCPALVRPVVSTKPGNNSVQLTWAAVPNASKYRVLRSDIGCARGPNIVAEVAAPATTYTDEDISNGFTLYYRIQAIGSNGACESAVSECVDSAGQPLAGVVKFDAASYGCSNTVGVRVSDANTNSTSVLAEVWSNSEPTPEIVVLGEQVPLSGKYFGTLLSTSAPPVHGDGKISIGHGETIHARYIDADDGQGGVNLPREATSLGDCVFPVISTVRDTGTTDRAATIQWTTDEVSDSQLVWGPAKPPGTPSYGDPRTTSHSVSLSGLTSCTVYWYEVRSKDPAGNLATSNDGGRYYHFETLGNFGDGLQPCHAGRVTIDAAKYSCSQTATFRVVDMDLNRNPLVAETATLLVTSTTETRPEVVLVTETGPDTSKFTGSIAIATGTPGVDGTLQVQGGDVMTVTYLDGNDGTGATATSYATASLDCSGPTISNLQVATITDARATLRFDTQEGGTTVVEWGTTPALGQTITRSNLTTAHDVVLNQFSSCQEVYFRVRTADTFGNETVVDNGGQPFRFHTGTIPGLYWKENFEQGTHGWTLGGEWEVGAPQGKGGSVNGGNGQPDPASAYNNGGVLGEDLTGRGTYPGGYENNVSEIAKTPALNASTWTNTKLIFYRRLQSGDADEAAIWVTAGIGRNVYRDTDGNADADFVYQSLDLGQVDGAPSVVVDFRLRSNQSGSYAGWTIDDVILKNGSLPDYAGCRDCASSPSFAGATSAIDNNACGATGVTVSWKTAASWGSAWGGTYSVYRGTAPGFAIDAAHRIATGVTGLSYNDATAPAGTLYYLVRAESDETCSNGPKNGGVTDNNTVYVGVTETTSRPVPGGIGDLAVSVIAKTHVHLGWGATSNATSYRVLRSPTPAPGDFGTRGTTPSLAYDDLGAGATRESYFYLVRGQNPCGTEGP